MTLGYNSEILFNNQNLYLTSITRKKVPKTRKQKCGGKVVLHTLPATEFKDYQIDGSGIIFDTSTVAATTARRVLEDVYNNQEDHQYSDGYVTSTFIITELEFEDTDEAPLNYTYKITLLELNEDY
jgi:hypothetical protein